MYTTPYTVPAIQTNSRSTCIINTIILWFFFSQKARFNMSFSHYGACARSPERTPLFMLAAACFSSSDN